MPVRFFLAFLPSLSAAEKPNVLPVLPNDPGCSELGCHGGENPTPDIDAFSPERFYLNDALSKSEPRT
jgi:arylsulfatase A-like enzyme